MYAIRSYYGVERETGRLAADPADRARDVFQDVEMQRRPGAAHVGPWDKQGQALSEEGLDHHPRQAEVAHEGIDLLSTIQLQQCQEQAFL